MPAIEICIDCDGAQPLEEAVEAAYGGGAARVELCGAMQHEGLTPGADQIAAARRAFRKRPGLMVMVRPRPGNFVYTDIELQTMQRQLATAARLGADGVVFGVLRPGDGHLATQALRVLLADSARYGLKTTFHRAFDAMPDPFIALEELIDLGVDRILTSGTVWRRPGGALDGVERLGQLLIRAAGRIEIVVGGGVNPGNIGKLLAALPREAGPLSLHAYSGAQEGGQTTTAAVQALAVGDGRAG
ncbi:MAG: copper homeostasis protein CutC [Candidatus Latescibacteria bacterium]|nr:copper homeostasis protein CutC [Candidatus Latescibacterota bacterium]